ncbi:hypothetical protein FFK22_011535 [Mycobacterium sp. KBS0706]|uniref:DUF6152 family protein n=1 Tax=Mycobacterium sp. KBS0706 TaxID=2578109 RepID=UPI00110FCB54|nr:DUF6152 family protein [Mycobacterium sp. KBS0706]TSD88680.1 hypothetical protein FFK22_011535 [Mycobacterium sp. KBS0706]
MPKIASLPVLLLAAVVPATALAHHGWSSYDANTTLTLSGPIETASYQNPHGQITLTQDGKSWQVVLSPPSRMDRRGLPREDLVVGKPVTVVGYPSRVVADEMRAERITIDGRTVELR